MGVVDEILGSLRLSGGVVFDARMTGAWRLAAQLAPAHCTPWFPQPMAIISYHFVRQGTVTVRLPGQPSVTAEAGTMILFPRNDPHEIYSDPACAPVDLARYVRPGSNGALNRLDLDFGGAEATCYCGWLGLTGQGHPLLDALPPMLVVRPGDRPADWIASSLQAAAHDWTSSPLMVAQVSRLLFHHAVHRHLATQETGRVGWLSAMTDPVVARALGVIHARYAEDFDVDQLAREAGVSRSVLGQRFSRLLGEPPMRYCARWRMRMAANRLLDGASPATVAHEVGFRSEAAFSRAFRREFGSPPAAWKRDADTQAAMSRRAYSA